MGAITAGKIPIFLSPCIAILDLEFTGAIVGMGEAGEDVVSLGAGKITRRSGCVLV
jgi:hypothetical protein